MSPAPVELSYASGPLDKAGTVTAFCNNDTAHVHFEHRGLRSGGHLEIPYEALPEFTALAAHFAAATKGLR